MFLPTEAAVNCTSSKVVRYKSIKVAVAAALALTLSTSATAQNALMQCSDSPPQDAAKIFRSGLWKQWIYWAIPGPTAYAAVERIVAEVNVSRGTAGLPYLVPIPGAEIVVSVFDERNARGANGSSTLPETSNQEAFLATFVQDTAGGFEVLFLTDPLRSNAMLTTAKAVPGVAAIVERSMHVKLEEGVDRVATEWELSSAAGDKINFSARYLSTAIYAHTVGPAARVAYANCNLTHSADVIYRSAPTVSYRLFAREAGNYVDLARPGVRVKVRVRHHDVDVNSIFNDPANVPELLIAVDRDVRIERR